MRFFLQGAENREPTVMIPRFLNLLKVVCLFDLYSNMLQDREILLTYADFQIWGSFKSVSYNLFKKMTLNKAICIKF